MTRVFIGTYVVMAIWLVFASAGRVALFIGNGQDMDLLPFGSFLLGILALVLLVPSYEAWLHRRDKD